MKFDKKRNINTENYVYNAKTKKYVKESSLSAARAKQNAKKSASSSNAVNGTSSSKSSASKKTSSDTEKQSLGKCPVCGKDVFEYEKGFFCENYRKCKYGIWKEDRYFKKIKKKPTKTMVKSLLKKGEADLKSAKDQNGNKFNAVVKYEKNPATGMYGWIVNRKED